MKTLIKSLLLLLACTLAGQVAAQSIKIGDVQGLPGETVTVDVTLTPDPTGANVVSAIDLFMLYSQTYDALTPDAGAPCGGDVVLPDVNTCQWGGAGSGGYSIIVVKGTGFGLVPIVIARTSFTISTGAIPGTVDTLVSDPTSVIGPAPTEVLPGSITVVSGPQPDWSSSPTSVQGLNFGSHTTGTSQFGLDLDVTNAGVDGGSLLSGTCDLGGSAVFNIVSGNPITDLAEGNLATIRVNCDTIDAAVMTHTGTLACDHNGDGTTEKSITNYPLTCVITATPEPAFSGTPSGLDSMSVPEEGDLPEPMGTLTIENKGDAGTLLSGSCTASGDDAAKTSLKRPKRIALGDDVYNQKATRQRHEKIDGDAAKRRRRQIDCRG